MSQMEETESQIAAERQRMVRKAAGDYQAAQRRERLLKDAMQQQQRELSNLSQLSIPYNILKREAEANKQLYDGLLQRVKEAGVTAGLKSTNIRIIDPALKPLHPTKPNKPRNIALGVIFGMMVGVAYAFMRERLDNSIKTPDELERLVPYPALGFIPAATAGKARERLKGGENGSKSETGSGIDLIPLRDPRSAIAESYRTLRTALLLSTSGQPPQVILVTSAQPQEGTTCTALNLAISLAQRGGDILLLDGDLRMPRIARALRIDWPYGLSNILTGTHPADQVIFRCPEIQNLYVLPSGPSPPNPAELLGSETMAKLLVALRSRFAHIIIDSPPILSITD
ncbi:MAG: polysaccharide biosynthesis tyrosine autokinase, partial [Burkholderiales bacterium]